MGIVFPTNKIVCFTLITGEGWGGGGEAMPRFKAASPNSLVYRNECLPRLLKLRKGVSLYQQ